MSKRYGRVIWWIKRDIRLKDNEALSWALDHGEDVLPLYVIEPAVVQHPDWSGLHAQAVAQAIAALQGKLAEAGARLAVARADILTVLDQLRRSLGFDAMVAHEETGPLHTYRRDIAVRRWCKDLGLAFHEVPRNGVIRALATREDRMKIWRARMESPIVPAPSSVPQSEKTRAICEQHQEENALSADAGGSTGVLEQPVSEEEGRSLLDGFLTERARDYRKNISAVEQAAESCSRLSIHLAWGTLSMRQVSQALEARREELASAPPEEAKGLRGNLAAFRSRIFWHDHFAQRLEDEPDMEMVPLNRAFERVPYVQDPREEERLLAAWLDGRTGFPMVDACMRRFAATGWLNFRMRAMVVSFACHVLHLDWRDILWPMARLMADYIPGIHLSQTQMQAGVIGINTFRIYKPSKQLTDHDPECTFVRNWLPELSEASVKEITAHEQEPIPGYAPPIVDYATQAKTMRSALWSIKKSDEGRNEASRVLEKHGSRLRGRR